jgi:hypothetical protein
MKKKESNTHRDEVILCGFNGEGVLVAEERLSVFDFYENLHAIMDEDSTYRVERKIVRVVGSIYNNLGHLDQEFVNDYDADGEYIHSRIVFCGRNHFRKIPMKGIQPVARITKGTFKESGLFELRPDPLNFLELQARLKSLE